ncbi:MAG TPA: D-2-hydroxyacid dehydrogenase [Chloroflexota bacterium]|nr:D-2-hydroxyacid dehydrogenase [Chloroflexota bacterium]
MPESTTGAGLTIFLTGEVNAQQLQEIRDTVPAADVRYFDTQTEMEREIELADVVAGAITAPALARAKKLKWVQSWGAGTNQQLFPEMVASPVTLTSVAGNGAISMAEHAVMLMLMLARDTRRWLRNQDEKKWERWFHPELTGQTCGIIGLGYSGQDLALKLKAFHMRVIGLRRTPRPTPNVDEVFPRERLHDMLAQSDFVVVTAPRTPETRGMLGEAELRAMKPSAFYICYSRGGIADDAALLRALNEGWIAGAGLDAHTQEPLPPDSPFWTAPNTIITPHNSATSPMSRERRIEIFIENLQHFVAGEPLRSVVNKEAGY